MLLHIAFVARMVTLSSLQNHSAQAFCNRYSFLNTSYFLNKSISLFCALQRIVFSEKFLRSLLNTANVVEFEWIRQYYVQGAKHRETHEYWEVAMAELVALWNELLQKTALALGVLRDAAGRIEDSVLFVCLLTNFDGG